ncbi:MAG: hypothetical protein KDA69_17940, partial [Planctomycetaceae bacterium]|nr:hypothetical protein [Planctomycetaceae bacterium]
EGAVEWSSVTKIRQAFSKTLPVHAQNATEIDVPLGKGSKRFASIAIDSTRDATRLNQVSHIRHTAFEQPVHFWSPIRVFVSPDYQDVITQHRESIIRHAEEQYFHPTTD